MDVSSVITAIEYRAQPVAAIVVAVLAIYIGVMTIKFMRDSLDG
jgi:hypothetical protein